MLEKILLVLLISYVICTGGPRTYKGTTYAPEPPKNKPTVKPPPPAPGRW